MKRVLTLFGVFFVFLACSKDSVPPLPGGITGSVSDKTTGEPVATVNVSLSPSGQSTVTGSDGTFSFGELDAGTYTVAISKEGYLANDGTFSVVQGKQTPVHLLIERIPSKVSVDKDTLDFGSAKNFLSFRIVNSSYEDLAWGIEYNCPWIQEVKPKSGTLGYGKTETITVVINRDLLDAGENKTVLVVRSTNGSSQVEVKAVGEERVFPVLNTLEVTDIMRSSATLNGEILNAGTPAYTERGFVYNTEPKPTLENTLQQLTAPVTDSAIYSCRIEGLTMDTTYYVRAYAKNSNGVSYASNEVSFVPLAVSSQVSIQEATDINVSARTAVLHGTIVNAGDPSYTERGFVYNDQPAPTINDHKVKVDGNETGPYSIYVTDLSLDKVFYARAYVQQKENIYYSSETVHFILSTDQPQSEMVSIAETEYSAKRAKFTGRIIDEGKPPYSRRGFVYGFSSNPVFENAHFATATGNGMGEFSLYVSELAVGQKYFVRVFTEQEGKVFYSDKEQNFSLEPIVASVSSTTVSDVGTTTVNLTASIIEVGDPGYTERGFVFSTEGNPLTNRNSGKIIVEGTGKGAFSSRISDLTGNTLYYVRAYVKQNGNTYYGRETSFQTTMEESIVITNTVSNVMYTTATLNATISTIGNPVYNRRGFYYGTNAIPTETNGTIVMENANSSGDYSMPVTGLQESTTYYFRAFLFQPGESVPVLGEVKSFMTNRAPNITTGGVTDITCSGPDERNFIWSATFYGGFSDEGNPACTEVGFVYGTTNQPTIDDGSSIYMTTTSFQKNNNTLIFKTTVSGLSTGVHYYIRAVGKTPLGYVYGEPIEFTPAVIIPVVRTYSAPCYRYNDGWTVTFNGLAESNGQPSIVGFGFVYGFDSSLKVDDGSSIAVSAAKINKSNNLYAFSTVLNGLEAGKNYYVRVYIKTQLGYTYGEALNFRTY